MAKKSKRAPSPRPETALGRRVWPGWLVLLAGTLVPFLVLMTAFFRTGLWPFGMKDILEVDGVHQYLPFLTQLRRALVMGQGLFYSFSGGLGFDFWATIAYYAASPFNLLMVLVPEERVCDFMLWMMPLKLSLSGGVLAWYLWKRDRGWPGYAVALGTLYALSNFFLGYKFNVMWLDSIAVTPLVLWALERLVREKRSGVYIAALFYCIWCNYYIAYMVCLFLCLWFLYLLWTQRHPFRETALRFALSSLSAGGMAAVLLLPAFLSLRMTTSAGAGQSVRAELYTQWFALLRSHFMDTEAFRTSYSRGDAQIYCGVIVLLLAALYFVNPAIERRQRIGMGALLGLLTFSFAFAPLNFLWHGLHLEVGLPNRFAFLYLLVVAMVSHSALCHLSGLTRRRLVIALVSMLALALAAGLKQGGEVVPSLAALALYALALTAMHWRGERVIALILCAGMVAESGVHCVHDFVTDGGDKRDYYVDYQQDAQTMLAAAGDTDFYRMDVDSDSMINFASFIGGRGVALFHSGMQASVQRFFEQMHAYVRLNTVWYKGISKPLMDIVGQRYLFTAYASGDTWNGLELVDSINGRNLYRNPDALSVGYVVSPELVNWDPAHCIGMDAENTFFHLACGAEELFQQQMYFYGRSDVAYQLALPDTGMTFALLDGGPEKVSWKTPEAERTYEKRTHMIFQGSATEPGQHVTLTVTTEDGSEYTGYSYTADGTAYRAAIEKLKESQLEQVEVHGNTLTGTVDAKQEGLLLLTIPAHPGWRVRLDGKACDVTVIGGVFQAVPVTAGAHTLEMTYTPAGFWPGLVISLASLALAVAILTLQRKRTGR